MTKKMLHGITVKWKCDVCGGFESAIDEYYYREKPAKPIEQAMLRAMDIAGEKNDICLCPKCVYRGVAILRDMLIADQKGDGE